MTEPDERGKSSRLHERTLSVFSERERPSTGCEMAKTRSRSQATMLVTDMSQTPKLSNKLTSQVTRLDYSAKGTV